MHITHQANAVNTQHYFKADLYKNKMSNYTVDLHIIKANLAKMSKV